MTADHNLNRQAVALCVCSSTCDINAFVQGAMPGGGPGASPALQSAVDALSGFLADARRLLDEQATLYRRFDELPNWRKGLTG